MPIYEILSDGTATLYGKPCKRGGRVFVKKETQGKFTKMILSKVDPEYTPQVKFTVYWEWDSGDGHVEYIEQIPVITVNYRVEANKIASAINDAEREWDIEQKRKAEEEAIRKAKEAEEAKKKVSIKGSIAPTNPWGKK